MTMQRWNPFLRDFVSLRDAVDRLFEESFVSPERLMSWRGTGTRPMPLEIYETPDDIVVRALTPGVAPDQLDVLYQQGTLTLRARTETPSAHDDWTWHLREFGYGEMVRTISLPREINAEAAEASFEHGVLTLRLPKADEAKPRQIPISGQQVQIESGTKS
jgi:HSP20 family protein